MTQNILWIKTYYILRYLHANNLYGYTRSEFLPTGGFKWINPKGFNSNKYSSNSLKGCVLEVDLEYSKELHDLHNDYSLVPDKIEIIKKIKSNLSVKDWWFLQYTYW